MATYTLSYNGNADGLGQMNEDVLEGTTIELPHSSFTRIGYIFGYWSVSPDGSGITYYPGDPFPMPSSNFTFFAVWRDDNIINQAFIDVGVTLKQNVNYIMSSDVTMTVPFQFTEPGTGITFDGQGQKINVIGTGTWPGLFSKPVTVQTVGIISARSTAASAGWFFADGVAGSATKCYSTGPIGESGGGIFGATSSGSAINCYSIGPIGVQAGGILGASSSGSATNCYSTGIIGNNGGGIFGNGSSSTPTNYYSLNGENWSDADANNNLIGYPGSSDPQVWSSVGADTPYLLLSNPQTSSNTNLTSVVVNGEILTPNSGIYTYSFPLNATSTSVTITSEEPHAAITISNIVGNFPGYHIVTIDPLALSDGINSSTITVLALDGTTTATYTLVINVPIEITQSVIDVAGFSLLDSTTYIMTEDVSMGSPFLFADGATGFGIIFDGSGHTVGVTGLGADTWTGLFSNAVTVQNVGILSAERSTAFSAGWFFADGVAGSATKCYSTGPIGESGGGIFGASSSGSATNCYSTGTMGIMAGGILGSDSQGSATSCYSTGPIGSSGGGIFGVGSSGSATNCYSIGPIGDLGGGIFGRTSNGTAIKCYSTGTISSQAGGIFGFNSDGPATNCYSTGTIGQEAGGIYGPISSDSDTNCYIVNGGAWDDISANNRLIDYPGSTEPVWASVIPNTPYLLVENPQPLNDAQLSKVFVNGILRTNISGSYKYIFNTSATLLPISIVTNESHAFVRIQDLSGYGNLSGFLTINPALDTFTLPITVTAQTGVLATYNLIINKSVPVLIDQAFIDAGTSLVINTPYFMTADVSMNSPFLFEDDNTGIIFDGSGHTINVRGSGTWAGLFSNAVTVQNVGILSAERSTAASAGWFFADGVAGSATKCYSTGPIGQDGGGIFGATSSGSATNCYSTGTIGQQAGGIFGYNSDGPATNCYSIGTIGTFGGGIFGVGSSSSATNCYSTGPIGQRAGGIFGQASTGPAENCYSTGTIGQQAGGIYGKSSSGSATNCYSTGTIGSSAGGIYGQSSTGTATNFYIVNGGLWIDASANEPTALTDLSGSTIGTAVWFRYNDVPDTPYLLVANPQPPSDDDDLLTVIVNGSTRTASNNSYAYTFDDSASTIPISIVTEQPHAIVSIENQDLSGGGDLSGSLPIVTGVNEFVIIVTAQTGAPTTRYPLTIYNPSNDDDLSLVAINGTTVDILEGQYNYSFISNASSVPVRVTTNEPNARARIVVSDLSGSNDLSGSLLINPGQNIFSIDVVAQSGASTDYPLTIQVSLPTVYINQAFIDAGAALVNYTPYIMTADVSMNDPFTFASPSVTGITFDGSGHTINVRGSGTWAGLFSNAVTVQNVGILSARSTAASAGWFFADSIGGSATNCYSTGAIGQDGGGIFGQNSSGSATSCYSTGTISERGGGIFGTGSLGPAENCYSTGGIGQRAGGICGNQSYGPATNCYSTGPIGNRGGGIFGQQSAGAATNCYSTGTIGSQADGIFGYQSSGSPINCYSLEGERWTDASANEVGRLIGYLSMPVVWRSVGANTPYLLISNPQTSSNTNLTSVAVNGETLPIDSDPFRYYLTSYAASTSVAITTQEPHALITITNSAGDTVLDGYNILDSSLTSLAVGLNTFTISTTALDGTTNSHLLKIYNNTVEINQDFIDESSTLMDNVAYIISGNVNMGSPFLFAVGATGAGITVNGDGYTVTVPTNNWPGLFSKPVTVLNVGILSTQSTAQNAGWFFADGVGGSATNCYSTGPIGSNGGGIFGRQSNGTAANCYSEGAIGKNGGGIFGEQSTGTATNCHSDGAIDQDAGGIFGEQSTGPALGCFTIGDISSNGGGIFGQGSNGPATNCYSIGAIGQFAGGIFGRNSESNATAANCYSTGTIDVSGDGIFGPRVGAPPTPSNCYVVNGGLWSDASANNNLIGYPGSAPPIVWTSVGADTPYLLLSNPQISSNINLTSVLVDGATLTANLGTYSYSFVSLTDSTSVAITSEEPHALITITDSTGGLVLSDYHILTDPLPLSDGLNTFTITVRALDGTTLATHPLVINTPVEITQTVIDAVGFSLLDSTIYIMTEDVEMTVPFQFADGASGTEILFDGSGHTINVIGEGEGEWLGLFSNALTVQNVGILSTRSTATGAGWFFANNLGGSATNCYSTGPIGTYGGGIFGSQSIGTATNCYSTGDIGYAAGGIVGLQSTGTATNCYSIGPIGTYGGGIFGGQSGGTATNCYSTGAFGESADGIFGAESSSSPVNCYSLNGARWSDASANAVDSLIGYLSMPVVWRSVGANTPYLLISNPQSSSNTNLTSVVVNGETLIANSGTYSYTFFDPTDLTSVAITSQEPHAKITITDSTGDTVLDGYHIVTGSLAPLGVGPNSFTITVLALDNSTLFTPTLTITVRGLYTAAEIARQMDLDKVAAVYDNNTPGIQENSALIAVTALQTLYNENQSKTQNVNSNIPHIEDYTA